MPKSPLLSKFKVYDGGKSSIIATYDYRTDDGKLLFQVCRTADKRFFQRRPDGDGGWISGLGGVKPVLYRLPEVLQAVQKGETIFIPEGEKDCDNLARLGMVATTNPFGAGKWRNHYSDWLRNAIVVILPDNDEPGQKHAEKVALSLHGKAASAKVLKLPGLTTKGGDVSDWLAVGNTKEELLRLAAEAPQWKPSKHSSKQLSGKETEKTEKELRNESQAEALIRIATTHAFLFHNELKEGFANFLVDDHRETCQVGSRFFCYWLLHRFYEETDKSPNNQALRQALNLLEAKAIFDGPEVKLNLRVAKDKDAIWYDLVNAAWQAVKITPEGWEVVSDPPILFRRFKNTAAQVTPRRSGKLDLLRKYINLQEETWILLFAQIIHAFVPGVPHPVVIFHGDKGAAKSTAQRVIRKLIDPAYRDTMTMPANKNELALMLMTNYAPIFDNLDGLVPWQSDMLCQAATGGGISKRELYTDLDEVIISFLRCPMVNGINQVATRDDLLDRSILVKLERIKKRNRKTESEFWEEFERDRPYIVGAILDALSGALRVYPTVKLTALPRMADYAKWGYAIAEAIGYGGENFLSAYYKNISEAVEEAVTGDVVGAALVEFMEGKMTWKGTATELLRLLEKLPNVDKKSSDWPKGSNVLSRKINALRSALEEYGIEVVTDKRSGVKRSIIITKKPK